MERGSIVKVLFLVLAVFLVWTVGVPLFFGSKSSELQPLVRDWVEDRTSVVRCPAGGTCTPPPVTEETCSLEGPRFRAEFGSRGASLRHVTFTEPKYQQYHETTGFFDSLLGKHDPLRPIDLVTTWREHRMPLR